MSRRAVQPLARPYIMTSTLIAVMAIVGFWPTYLQPLVTGISEAQRVIHFHAVVYFGWLALFVTQAWFAASGQLRLHLRLGKIGIIYGTAMIPVGLLITFSRFADRVAAGNFEQAQSSLIFPLVDMLIFPPFFFAAVYYRRRKPEIHKRLMIVASTYLLVAAVARMPGLGFGESPALSTGIWIVPIVLAMGHDFVSRRIVHPVYVIGIVTIALSAFRRVIGPTEVWQNFTTWAAAVLV